MVWVFFFHRVTMSAEISGLQAPESGKEREAGSILSLNHLMPRVTHGVPTYSPLARTCHMATTCARDAGKCTGEQGHLVSTVSDTICLVRITSSDDMNVLIHLLINSSKTNYSGSTMS